jgi:hypothetical protein
MKMQRAIEPNTLVKTICPMFPTAMATTPITLRFGDRKNTRPPYSPNLFGVKTAQVKPQKTDSMDFHKLISSTLLIRRFHLKASKPQLTNIKENTIDSITVISVLEMV